MKFTPNEYVKIKSSGHIKLISESEIINGIEIYYMSDKTSYCGSQIENSDPNEIVNSLITENREVIREVFRSRIHDVAIVYKKRREELLHLNKKEKETKKNLWEKILSFFLV